MTPQATTILALTGALCLTFTPACSAGDQDDASATVTTTATTTATTAESTTTSESTTASETTGAVDGPLCVDLGGYAGVQALVGAFVGEVLTDERINAYFLTTAVDGENLARCLNEQLGEAAGCAGVTYTCRDMKSSHAGLGISSNDFMDLASDFSVALDEHMAATPTLTDADKAAILELLGSMAPDIVEDPDNNLSAYQRLGRKPGMRAVVNSDDQSFIPVVAADPAINGFFGTTDIDRLTTCLVRQFTAATGGPDIYGKEVDAPAGVDPGASAANPCKDMMSSHKALKDPGDGLGIQFEDFTALVADLEVAMTSKGVPADEQTAILGALAPLCAEIVTVDPESCP